MQGLQPVQKFAPNYGVVDYKLPFFACVCGFPIRGKFIPGPSYFLHFICDFMLYVNFFVDDIYSVVVLTVCMKMLLFQIKTSVVAIIDSTVSIVPVIVAHFVCY